MNDAPVELWRGEFAISTDRARIDPDAALALLHTTHWGGGMERTATLIGFGRAVTDLATYGFTVGPGPLTYMEHCIR